MLSVDRYCFVYKETFHIFEQMEEVIEDIISMQSSYDDIKNYVDPMVQMPNTVSEVTPPFVYCFDPHSKCK